MSDKLTAWLRTVVPGLWAALVVFLVKQFGLPSGVADWLSSTAVTEAVTNVVALAAVYALIRWVEPRLPDGLTRILLGSAVPPTYSREG